MFDDIQVVSVVAPDTITNRCFEETLKENDLSNYTNSELYRGGGGGGGTGRRETTSKQSLRRPRNWRYLPEIILEVNERDFRGGIVQVLQMIIACIFF